MVLLALAALLVLLLAPPAAGADDLAERAFLLSPWPAEPTALDVANDGTVWGTGEAGLWRLRPGEGASQRVSRSSYLDVSIAPDGSLLLVEEGASGLTSIWRRGPGGDMVRLAGLLDYPAEGSLGADGGPALGAALCGGESVEALQDGGFILTDKRGRVVRRVGRDGTISTRYVVPGATGEYGCETGMGGPPSGTIREIVSVDRADTILLRVGGGGGGAAGGAKGTAAGRRSDVVLPGASIGSVAAGSGGSLVYTSGSSVRRLAGGARRAPVVLRGGMQDERVVSSPFDRDGLLGAEYVGGPEFERVAVAPDGGLVASGTPLEGPSSLVYLTPARPRVLALALDPRASEASGSGYVVRYRSTRPVTANALVRTARGVVVARARSRGEPGLNAVPFRHRFTFRPYDVRVSVTTADGRRAEDVVRVYLGGTIPLEFARRLLVPDRYDPCGGAATLADADPCEAELLPVRSRGCQRFGPRRVDCRWSYQYGDLDRTCVMRSAQLGSDGSLSVTTYQCPSARRFPRRPPRGELRQLLPEQDEPGGS